MRKNVAVLTEIQCMWNMKVNNFIDNIRCDLKPREIRFLKQLKGVVLQRGVEADCQLRSSTS
jgi:hypothetical protein